MDQQTQSGLTSATQVMGTLVSARGSLEAGKAQEAAARYSAAQLRQNAGQVEASSQRASEEKTRQAKLMASRALAVAGASGAGVSDVTMQNLLAQITGEGKLASLTSLYEGQTEAAGMRRQATATEYEGASARTASRYKAFSTLLEGGRGLSSMFPSDEKPKMQKAAPIIERKWG